MNNRSLLRRLWRTLRTNQGMPPRPHPRLFGPEPLEGRLMMSVSPLPDLSFASVKSPTGSGQDVSVQLSVTNSGTSAAGAHTDKVFLSADGTLNANDILLGQLRHTDSLAPGARYDATLPGNLPGSVANGVYQVLVVTDANNEVAESNETNNVLTAGVLPVFNGAVPPQAVAVRDFFQNVLGGNIRITQLDTSKGTLAVKLDGEPGGTLLLGGFKFKQFTFTASLSDGVSGSGSAQLDVPLPGAANPATITLNLSLDQKTFKVDGTLAVPDQTLGSALFVKNATLKGSFRVDFATRALSGGVTLTADQAILLPRPAAAGQTPTGGAATFSKITATIDSTGKFTLTTDLDTTVQGVKVKATGGTLTFGGSAPAETLFSVPQATLTLPLSGKNIQARATNLKIHSDGRFTIDSAELDASAGLLQTLNLGGVLPFDLTTLKVQGLNNQPIRLDAFDVVLSGKFNFSVFDELGGDHVVLSIGATNLTRQANTFNNLTFRIQNGNVSIQNTGTIALTLKKLDLSPLHADAKITLGGIVNGKFVPNVSGALTVTGDVDDLTLGGGLSFAGTLTPDGKGGTALDATTTFSADFALKNGTVQVRGAGVTFGLHLAVGADGRLSGDPTLDLRGLELQEVKVSLGGVVTLRATGGEINFAPPPGAPLAHLSSVGLSFGDGSGGDVGGAALGGQFDLLSDGTLVVKTVDSLKGFSVGTPQALELGPVEVSGDLAFDSVNVNGRNVAFARIHGAFKFNDIGAGIDLVLTQLGPVLATVSAPLAVPLGPTGLALVGATGGLVFGSTIPDVQTPDQLLFDPAHPENAPFQNPLKQVNGPLDDFIRSKVADFVGTNRNTLSGAFTLVLSGKLTHVASAGLVTADVTLGANINLNGTAASSAGLKLLGFGEVSLAGFDLNQAGLILDLTSPLEPKISAAFQTPTPGNPLAFILPVHDTVVAQLDTKGLALGTAVGVRTFIDRVVASTLSEGQAFFRAVLDRMADRIQAHPTSPLGLALLDTNGDGRLSAAERQPLADAAAFKQGFGARLQALFQTAVAGALSGLNDAQVSKLVVATAGFVDEFLGAIDDVQKAGVTGSFTSSGSDFADNVRAVFDGAAKPLLAFADIVRQAVVDATVAAADVIDPSLVLHGKLQPTIFGIPFGPPKADVDLTFDKKGLFLQTDFSPTGLASAFNLSTPAPLLLNPLPDADKLYATVRLPFAHGFRDLALGKLPLIDPDHGPFQISLQGTESVGGFPLTQVTGAIFSKNDPALAQLIQVGGGPAGPGRVRVADQATFQKLQNNGGVLLDGQLTLPKLITNPADVISRAAPLLVDAARQLQAASGPARAIGNILAANLSSLPALVTNPTTLKGIITQLTQLGQSVGTALAELQQALDILGEEDQVSQLQLFLPNVLAGGQAADAYLVGQYTARVFGVSLGSGTLSVENGKLIANGTLLGVHTKVALDRGPNGQPRAALDVSLGDPEMNTALTALGAPANLFETPADAGARLRAFTPGFDPASTDLLRRNGGVELSAELSIPNVVDNATFLFRVTPPTQGTIPDFVAATHVDQLNLSSLLPGSSLSLSNIDLTITKTGSTTTVHLRGTTTVLGSTFTAEGDLQLGSGGVSGFVRLTGSDRATTTTLGAGQAASFSGDFFLLLNTTSSAATVTINGQAVTIEGPSARLHVAGRLTAGGFDLRGRFDVSAGTSGLQVSVSGVSLNLGQFGTFTANGTFALDASGVVTSLTLSRQGGTGLLFGLEGTFRLRLNTTGATRNGIAPGVSVGISGAQLKLGDNTLTGSASITADSNRFIIRVDGLTAKLFDGSLTVTVSGTISSTGTVDVTGTGSFHLETPLSLVGIGLGTLKIDASATVHFTGSAAGGLSFSATATGTAQYVLPAVGIPGTLFFVPEQTLDVASLDLSINSDGRITATGSVLGVPFSHDFDPGDIQTQ